MSINQWLDQILEDLIIYVIFLAYFMAVKKEGVKSYK